MSSTLDRWSGPKFLDQSIPAKVSYTSLIKAAVVSGQLPSLHTCSTCPPCEIRTVLSALLRICMYILKLRKVEIGIGCAFMCRTTQGHLQVERSSSTVAARSHIQKHLQQMELRNLRPSVLTYGTLAGYLKTVSVELDLQSGAQDEHGREISSHRRCQRTLMLVMSRLPKDGMTRLSRVYLWVSFLTPAVFRDEVD